MSSRRVAVAGTYARLWSMLATGYYSMAYLPEKGLLENGLPNEWVNNQPYSESAGRLIIKQLQGRAPSSGRFVDPVNTQDHNTLRQLGLTESNNQTVYLFVTTPNSEN